MFLFARLQPQFCNNVTYHSRTCTQCSRFALAEDREKRLDNPFATDQIWKGDSYILDAGNIFHGCTNCEQGTLILQNHFNNSSNGASDTVVCCSFTFNNPIRGAAD